MNKRLLSLALALTLCLSLAVPARAAGSTFSDVPGDHWASIYVERACQEGAINGTAYNEATGERRFSPSENLTMAQFVTILCRKYYSEDLDASFVSGAWYAAAQETAERRGLLDGVSPNAGMTRDVSRSDMAAVLYNLLEDQGAAPSQADRQSAAAGIPDLEKAGAAEAVAAVVFLGIINGVDDKGTFDGGSFMTRAQAAAVYCRTADVLDRQADQAPAPGQTDPGTSAPETPQPGPIDAGSYEEVAVGDIIQLDIENTYGADIRLESSDPSVLRVGADNSVEALAPGKADLTVTITWQGLTQVLVSHVKVTDTQTAPPPAQMPPSTTPGQPGGDSQGKLLANGKEISDDNIREIIYGLKSQYPEGMRWTNDNDYLSEVMRTHGYGCEGFALICSDAAFGSLPLSGNHSDFDSVRVGDLLRVNNNTHTVIVLEKKADSVVVAEGNFNNSIHWGREISRSELVSGSFTVRTRYPA